MMIIMMTMMLFWITMINLSSKR